MLLNIIYGTDRTLGALNASERISTFTAIHFVVAREQPDVTSEHKLNQLKYFRLREKGLIGEIPSFASPPQGGGVGANIDI